MRRRYSADWQRGRTRAIRLKERASNSKRQKAVGRRQKGSTVTSLFTFLAGRISPDATSWLTTFSQPVRNLPSADHGCVATYIHSRVRSLTTPEFRLLHHQNQRAC